MPRVLGLPELKCPFGMEELRSTVFRMRSDNNPSPGGFGPCFFKLFWDLVKDDQLNFLEEFYHGRAHLAGINQVCIALLPKAVSVLLEDSFRPISL